MASRSESIKERFETLDVNKDGSLSFEEMQQLLRQGNPDMTRRQIRVLYDRVDKNSDERVSFAEFVDFVYNPMGAPGPYNGDYTKLSTQNNAPTAVIGGSTGHSSSEVVDSSPGPYGGDDTKLSTKKSAPSATFGHGPGHGTMARDDTSPGPYGGDYTHLSTVKSASAATIGGGSRSRPGMARLRAHYKKNDLNQDGRIDLDETKHLLLSSGRLTEAEVERLFRACDRDHSGTIEIEELYDFCFTGDRMSQKKYTMKDAFSGEGKGPGPGDYDLRSRDRVKGGVMTGAARR